MANDALANWAQEMRQVFRSGTTSQFVLYGNIFDLQPAPDGQGRDRSTSPSGRFLTEVMFAPFDVVLLYDRGKGIRVRKGGRPLPPLPQGLRHLPGHLVGGPPRRRSRQDGIPGPLGPPAPGTQAGPRAHRPVPAGRPGADEDRRRKSRGGPPQGGRPHRLRPLHRSRGGAALRLGRPEPVPHPDPGLVQRPGHHGGLRGHGPHHREPLADLNGLLVENPYCAKIQVPLPEAADLRQYISDAHRRDFGLRRPLRGLPRGHSPSSSWASPASTCGTSSSGPSRAARRSPPSTSSG